MKLQTITQALIDSGFTQDSLAESVRSEGASCTQPTIHRILKGGDPKDSVGHAIRRIYERSFEGSEAAA